MTTSFFTIFKEKSRLYLRFIPRKYLRNLDNDVKFISVLNRFEIVLNFSFVSIIFVQIFVIKLILEDLGFFLKFLKIMSFPLLFLLNLNLQFLNWLLSLLLHFFPIKIKVWKHLVFCFYLISMLFYTFSPRRLHIVFYDRDVFVIISELGHKFIHLTITDESKRLF